MHEIELKDVRREGWTADFNRVIADPYIIKKYNRKKRLKEKEEYVRSYLPVLIDNKEKNILDLGPGPGEFLEVCRELGHNVFGIDAKLEDCEMGTEYLELSMLMAERQALNVQYIGVDSLVLDGEGLKFEDDFFDVVNSQGSIEQIFKRFLIGEPHVRHKNCNLLSWNVDENTKQAFYHMLTELFRVMRNGGKIIIYGNGAKNVKVYDQMLCECVSNTHGLFLDVKHNERFHIIGVRK